MPVPITLVSPAGGQPPLDPKSDEPDAQTAETERFRKDPAAQQALANTGRLADVSAEDFDAVFYPGGHGPLWDLAEDKHSIALIEAFDRSNKPHGLSAMRRACCATSRLPMASRWFRAATSPVSPTLKKPRWA
jgi:putative intracellular protease/amidase